jgi:threonine aldolase
VNPELVDGFPYLRKQSLQLASKMRFLAAQFEALIAGGLWLRLARHANTMAARLAQRVDDLDGVTITRAVRANAVFARIPVAARQALQRRFAFYVWDESSGEVRWMCSWDTTEQDVDEFARALEDALASSAAPRRAEP